MRNRKYFNNWRFKQRHKLVAKGLCSNNCGRPLAIKWFCRECADKVNQYARNCRNNKIDIYRQKANIRNHKIRFDGLYEKVIERDKHSCQICGYSDKVRIHHINENDKDNRMENLICLCIICHTVIERINKHKTPLDKLIHIFPHLK